MKGNLPQQVLVPAQIFSVCAACGVNQVVLCCGLNLATRFVCSAAAWEGLQCRSVSGTACEQPCSYLFGAAK